MDWNPWHAYKDVAKHTYGAVTDPLGTFSNDLNKLTGGGGGTPQPYAYPGADKRQEGLNYAGIDPTAMNQQVAQAGEQQRQQNVAAYNAAIASQRGVNPTAAAMSMGNNLSAVNAQTGANVQNIEAQNSWQAQQANQSALLDLYRSSTGAAANAASNATAQRGQNLGLLGGIVGGLGAAFSDEHMKEPVDQLHSVLSRHLTGGQQMAQEGPKSTEDFMSSLKPQEFQYKPGTAASDGEKPHVGVMAQDLEKTPQGASAVMDTPEGKMVDTKQLAMMLAASIGDLHSRLSALEGKKYA